MLFGLVLLSGSTIFLCVATNIAMFLVGRVLQGFSAALTWTVGLALVVDTVDQRHIGMAMGWIGTSTSIGVLLAPLLGGLVYGKGGYYPVFAMCFGLLAVDILLRLAIIEVKESKKWLDPGPHLSQDGLTIAGETSSTPADAMQPMGVTVESSTEKGETRTDGQIQCDSPKTSGFTSVVGPLLSLLRKPRLLAALWGTLAHSVLQTSFDSTLPLVVKSIFHWDAIGAGLIFLPIILPSLLGPLVGILGDRYGPKWLATAGFLLAVPFLVCMRFVDENTMAHKVMLCGLLVGVGLAIVLVFGPTMAEITWSVVGDEPAGESASVAPYAQAYGLYNMAFSGGAMLGPIIGGLIRDSAGWPTVTWVLALVSGLTAVTQFIWVGPPLKSGKKQAS